MYVEPGEVYIRRVRAVSGERDPLALRARLAGALAQASMHPSGMPRSAVLCVRRLRAPRTGAYGLSHHNAHAQRAWAEACAESLARLLASAARPARGFVPAAAESVVFADRAELLACLAGDWCVGQAHAQWWWRALFKQTVTADAVAAAWRIEPEYVPGALAHLARQNLARDFALALPADSARAVLDGVVRRFALSELDAALADARSERAEASDTLADTEDYAAAFTVNAAHAAAHVAPWRHVVPEAESASLSPEAACLLGVGLTLQRAPVAARAPSFARAVREWLRARDATARARVEARAESKERTHTFEPEPEVNASVEQQPRLEKGIESNARTPFVQTEQSHAARDESETIARAETARPEATRSAHAPSVEREAAEVSFESDAQTESFARGVEELTHEEAEPHAHEATTAPTVREDVEAHRPTFDTHVLSEVIAEPDAEFAAEVEVEAASVETSAAAPLEAQVSTRFGGVFFLVNLGLFLELYGDFSAPLAQGIALPVWDFCALLGERMCGRALRADPVWALLAQLEGRDEKTQPGVGFEPPGDWRVPHAWLTPLPRAGAWRWAAARGRLRVVHPSGFVVLDVARDARARVSQLAAELEAYADLQTATPEHDERVTRERHRTSLARWLACVSAYARVRLCLALGCEARALSSLLFARQAHVSVTTTHVDVVMALSELPVELRMAGLDRDPGWVPAAGRFVAFHFD